MAKLLNSCIVMKQSIKLINTYTHNKHDIQFHCFAYIQQQGQYIAANHTASHT